MKKKTMTNLLHAILVVAVLLGAVFFFGVVPLAGREIRQANPEYAWAYRPCLIWAWAFAAPIFAAVIPCWRIFSGIAAPQGAFTRQNARSLRLIAWLAFADAVIFPAGMFTVAFMGAGQPGLTVIVTPLVIFCCIAVGIVALVLGHLVSDAVALREENDLTI
ncbi:MAG: DUF2975 domain-containing protein [Oscillospiraceae bacterium]|nr:DUF2975 domain-containing protein [Oscillospiraceae bacterium]